MGIFSLERLRAREEDVVSAWEGPVKLPVGAQTPPLGGGRTISVGEIQSALNGLNGVGDTFDCLPDLSEEKDTLSLLEGPSGKNQEDLLPILAEEFFPGSENDDFRMADFLFDDHGNLDDHQACKLSSPIHERSEDWETATVVADDVDIGEVAMAEDLEEPISAPTSEAVPPIVLVTWANAPVTLRRPLRLFLGFLARSKKLWMRWGLPEGDWETFSQSVQSNPSCAAQHVAYLRGLLWDGAGKTEVGEAGEIVLVVPSIKYRPEARLEVFLPNSLSLMRAIKSGQCSYPDFWSTTFNLRSPEQAFYLAESARRLVEEGSQSEGLDAIHIWLLEYIVQPCPMRHWLEEVLVNGLRITLHQPPVLHESKSIFPNALPAGLDSINCTRTSSINSLAGGVLPCRTDTPPPTFANLVPRSSSYQSDTSTKIEVDLSTLFDALNPLDGEVAEIRPCMTGSDVSPRQDPVPAELVGGLEGEGAVGQGKNMSHLSRMRNKSQMGSVKTRKATNNTKDMTVKNGSTSLESRPMAPLSSFMRAARTKPVKYRESSSSEFEEAGDDDDMSDISDRDCRPSHNSSLPRSLSNFTSGSSSAGSSSKKDKKVPGLSSSLSTQIGNGIQLPSTKMPIAATPTAPTPAPTPPPPPSLEPIRGRPPAKGREYPDRGRHKCRMPGCGEDYRWPDYFCKLHGGGRCQYRWWDTVEPECERFHQSKNSHGELLCGQHCRATGAKYGETTRRSSGSRSSNVNRNIGLSTTKKRKRAGKK